jgi:hypothetical protein
MLLLPVTTASPISVNSEAVAVSSEPVSATALMPLYRRLKDVEVKPIFEATGWTVYEHCSF